MLMVINQDRHPQHQCHRQAKLSRTLSSDELDEAPDGTKCVADVQLGTASSASLARWACTAALCDVTSLCRLHLGTDH